MVDIFWGFQWIFFYFSFDHFAERTGIDDENLRKMWNKKKNTELKKFELLNLPIVISF